MNHSPFLFPLVFPSSSISPQSLSCPSSKLLVSSSSNHHLISFFKFQPSPSRFLDIISSSVASKLKIAKYYEIHETASETPKTGPQTCVILFLMMVTLLNRLYGVWHLWLFTWYFRFQNKCNRNKFVAVSRWMSGFYIKQIYKNVTEPPSTHQSL